jgi:hypothetical protein
MKQRTSEEMFPVIECFLESDQTQKAFCAECDLPLSVFFYWLTKYRRQLTGDSGTFIELRRPDPVPAEMAHVEVLYANGTRVRLFSAVTPSYVTGLVSGVGP